MKTRIERQTSLKVVISTGELRDGANSAIRPAANADMVNPITSQIITRLRTVAKAPKINVRTKLRDNKSRPVCDSVTAGRAIVVSTRKARNKAIPQSLPKKIDTGKGRRSLLTRSQECFSNRWPVSESGRIWLTILGRASRVPVCWPLLFVQSRTFRGQHIWL